MAGPVALLGGGEYTPAMAALEAELLAGRPPRYIQLPTAAGREGARSVAAWLAVGRAQALRLGVTAVGLAVLDRAGAQEPDVAAQIAGAGLVCLSDGDPVHLVRTLRGSRVWAAIRQEWAAGAALAGSGAGAMALGCCVPDPRHPLGPGENGLAVVPALRVIPHRTRARGWVGLHLSSYARSLPPGQVLVGLDEDTALLCRDGGLTRWEVIGAGGVSLVTAETRRQLAAGEEVELDAHDPRAVGATSGPDGI